MKRYKVWYYKERAKNISIETHLGSDLFEILVRLKDKNGNLPDIQKIELFGYGSQLYGDTR